MSPYYVISSLTPDILISTLSNIYKALDLEEEDILFDIVPMDWEATSEEPEQSIYEEPRPIRVPSLAPSTSAKLPPSLSSRVYKLDLATLLENSSIIDFNATIPKSIVIGDFKKSAPAIEDIVVSYIRHKIKNSLQDIYLIMELSIPNKIEIKLNDNIVASNLISNTVDYRINNLFSLSINTNDKEDVYKYLSSICYCFNDMPSSIEITFSKVEVK